MNKADIVKDAIRRLKNRPKRLIARYILHNHGELFDGDLEKIRHLIRYYTGANGKDSRESVSEIIPHNSLMPKTKRIKRQPHHLPPGLYLLMADIHVPFHEPKPIEATIKYAQNLNVDGVILNGDIQDCAAVGFWPTRIKRDFDREFESTIDFLDFLDHEFPKQKKIYKMGNHEYRMDRYYQVNAPELKGIPLDAMDDSYDLDNRGYEVVDHNQMMLAGKLPIFHGHEFGRLITAVNPARGLFLKAKSWALCAHCHRTSEHPSRNIMGTYLTTWSVGCLCDLSPDYCPMGNDWNWGFCIINVEKDGNFEVENRRILSSGRVV